MFISQILPLRIVDLRPHPAGSSMDSPGVAVANDGLEYALKAATPNNPLLPATEAFCASLATACQLPVAVGAWLDDSFGNEYYGSRLEHGIIKGVESIFRTNQTLVNHTMKRRWQRCDNNAMASGIYAFDLFIFNYDRHLFNYIFQDHGSRVAMMAIDHSRALWVVSDIMEGLPTPEQMITLDKRYERTIRAGRIIRKWIGFDHAAASRTLEILRRVNVTWVQNFCTQVPQSWLPSQQQADLVNWWGSQARMDRIDAIEKGLNDGTLL